MNIPTLIVGSNFLCRFEISFQILFLFDIIEIRCIQGWIIMKKKYSIISNFVLLLWYFLAMTGVYFKDFYLVKRSYEDDWIFMIIPIIILIIFIIKEKLGKFILLSWLSLWFIIQFLSHEWYTIFGSGFMGTKEGKIEYFKDTIKFVNSETIYIPDVYHIILHILIIVAIFTTATYIFNKRSGINSSS